MSGPGGSLYHDRPPRPVQHGGPGTSGPVTLLHDRPPRPGAPPQTPSGGSHLPPVMVQMPAPPPTGGGGPRPMGAPGRHPGQGLPPGHGQPFGAPPPGSAQTHGQPAYGAAPPQTTRAMPAGGYTPFRGDPTDPLGAAEIALLPQAPGTDRGMFGAAYAAWAAGLGKPGQPLSGGFQAGNTRAYFGVPQGVSGGYVANPFGQRYGG